MDRPDGRGWWKTPKWVGRLIGRPVDWLAIKLTRRLDERDQQEPDPAQAALERTETRLTWAIHLFGPDGGPTAGARADVASQLEKMDRLAEARLLREADLDANRYHFGPEHLDTLTAEWWLATNLCRQHMIDETKPLVVHARDGLRLQLGPDNERTIEIEKLLSSLDAWTGGE
jgi:hypothetical protein